MAVEYVAPSKVIKVGQRIKVSLASDKKDNVYASRVEDVTDRYIIVAMPMDKGYPIIPLSGEMINVIIFSDQSSFRFFSNFIEKQASPLPVWKLTWPDKVEKYQQRAFVRVDDMIQLTAVIEDSEGNLSEPLKGCTRNVSGGGLNIILNHRVRVDDILHVETEDLPIVGKLHVDCKVKRVDIPVSTKGIYWVGVQFTNISDRDQTQLIRYIFYKQREMLSNRFIN